MKNATVKNIYILELNGYWDDQTQQITGSRPFDCTCDKNGNLVKVKSPVTFLAPKKFHLKKNTGKKNAIERPYIYSYAAYYSNINSCQKRDAKFAALIADLNTIDLSNCGHMSDNAELFYKLTVPVDKYDQIKTILKKHNIENVYIQVSGTNHYSSYTQEDLEKSFVKLS